MNFIITLLRPQALAEAPVQWAMLYLEIEFATSS